MIINFKKESTLRSKNNKIRDWTCRHAKLSIDEKRRLLTCDRCGQHIEPYDYLLDISKGESNLRVFIESLEHDKKNLVLEVDKLKVELQSLKGKVRRAKKKDVPRGTY
jgi:hypothetical protein